MAELIASGRVVDLIAGLMLLEFGVFTLLRGRLRCGPSTLEFAATLAAGLALLLALRAALVGFVWQHVATWLILSLIAHLLYLKLRWGAR